MIFLNQERACKHSKSRSHIGNDKKSSARRDEHISIYTSKKVPFQMKPSFATPGVWGTAGGEPKSLSMMVKRNTTDALLLLLLSSTLPVEKRAEAEYFYGTTCAVDIIS